jgi:acetoin utilization deacetylase AcuC-like enzyme
VPLRAHTPATEQKRVFDSALDEISGGFSPDLIIISAGFDSHNGDPLGQLLLEDDDFVSLTRTVKEWADDSCKGRIVSCLEGGYNLQTLGQTVRAHVAELAKNNNISN